MKKSCMLTTLKEPRYLVREKIIGSFIAYIMALGTLNAVTLIDTTSPDYENDLYLSEGEPFVHPLTFSGITDLTVINERLNRLAPIQHIYVMVDCLTASKGTSRRYINLIWDAPAGATSFRILRRPYGTEAAWTAIAEHPAGEVFNDADAALEEFYEYCVFALIPKDRLPVLLQPDNPNPEHYQDFGYKKCDHPGHDHSIPPRRNKIIKVADPAEDKVMLESGKELFDIMVPQITAEAVGEQTIAFQWKKIDEAAFYELQLVKEFDDDGEKELLSMLNVCEAITTSNYFNRFFPENESRYYFGIAAIAENGKSSEVNWIVIDTRRKGKQKEKDIIIDKIADPWETSLSWAPCKVASVNTEGWRSGTWNYSGVLMAGITTEETAEISTEKYNLMETGANKAEWFLPNLHYKKGSYSIQDSYKKNLEDIALILKSHPDLQLIVEGHTDQIGKEAKREKISYQRAKHIIDLLDKKFGIKRNRMSIEDMKSEAPLVPVTDSYMNRRVEFKVVSTHAYSTSGN